VQCKIDIRTYRNLSSTPPPERKPGPAAAGCVYRKPRFGSNGDEVHQGSGVNERFRSDLGVRVVFDDFGSGYGSLSEAIGASTLA
jgi:hypothetical protein